MLTSIDTSACKYIYAYSPPRVSGLYGTWGSAGSVGEIRVNPSGGLEVYTGSSWIPAGGNATIGLTAEAMQALDWASKKCKEEVELAARLEKFPALKKAYEAFCAMDEITKHATDDPTP